MKRFALWIGVIFVSTVTWAGAAAWAEASAPAPTKKRIVLHGVDCNSAAAEVCAAARPVFDEAIRILSEEDGPFVVSVAHAQGSGVPPATQGTRAAVDRYP